MNIFAVHDCPETAATSLCDQHVVKMVLETAQILSTVVIQQRPECHEILYKPTHAKHPCTLWAGRSTGNFEWLVAHGLALAEEYRYRYGKTHASERVILACSKIPLSLPRDRTAFAQAMPDQYRHEDPVEGYRAYYIGEKLAWGRWNRGRSKPLWCHV